jgi:hypothetical protein
MWLFEIYFDTSEQQIHTLVFIAPMTLPNDINIALYYLHNLIFQMPLSTQFPLDTIVFLHSLELDTPYNIIYAERVYSESGRTVLATLQSEEHHYIRYALPDNFFDFFTEGIINDIINSVRCYKLIHTKYENISHLRIILE